MSETAVRCALDGEGVFRITLNRPERLNAFNQAQHEGLIAALQQAERDPAVRCVVITGEGRAFCAGQDLQSIGDMPIGDLVRRYYNRWIAQIRSLEKPVLAAVNGVAAGAGVSLALACDLIVMAESAAFIQAFARIGLVPDSGASYFLPRLVGYHKAMELALFGDRVSAAEALSLGLCNRVVPDDQFEPAVAEWAGWLARGPRAVGWIKRQLNRGLERSLDEVLALEAYHQEIAAATEDAREGIRAFVERREPRFTGR
ncbi:enoyl-CoA hydratase-related protein [Symbiobacterium thermophilum]|uniref:enoyl-CoA hydratase-related protein n=2 Tax=Symbiobacterium thermophilum TaxID=2734 RepID=UPI0003072E8A|nr:enoyl-CoA hydratase-related protein [Symbiobacterium thermophilum]